MKSLSYRLQNFRPLSVIVSVLCFFYIFIIPILIFIFLSTNHPYCISPKQVIAEQNNWKTPFDGIEANLNRLAFLDNRTKSLLYNASLDNSITYTITITNASGSPISTNDLKASLTCSVTGGESKDIHPGINILAVSRPLDEVLDEINTYNVCTQHQAKAEGGILLPTKTIVGIQTPNGQLCLLITPTITSRTFVSLIFFGANVGLLVLLRQSIIIIRNGLKYFLENKER